MKKLNPHLAPVPHSAAGAAALAVPARRRPGPRPKVGRAVPSAPPLAERNRKFGNALGLRSALRTARPTAPGFRSHAPSTPYSPPFVERLSPEEVELRLLIEAVHLQSGFDFRNYRRPLVQQRVMAFLAREGLTSLSQLQAVVLRQPPVLERLLASLTGRQTSLFEEPAFYRAVRQAIIPWLRTYPFARVWVAGCGNGGEAYSLAAVLLEEGLQDRCRIYVTDLCEAVVRQAQAARWPLAALKRAAADYRQAGGKQSLAQYYTVEDGQARFTTTLTRNLVFAAHNLLTDASFNEFHLILCRAVMDDFDPILQGQVHDLLYGSLVPRGVLALGRHHNLNLTLHRADYEPLVPKHGIYRKNWPHGIF